MKYIFYIVSVFFLLLQSLYTVAQGFIIPSGAYVIAGNGNIVTKNNFVNNGSFTHNGGTIIFNGTTQSISGNAATVFNNITTVAGTTTTVTSAGQSVKGVILSNGTLNANSNLTLLSTAGQTACIDGTGTGEVTGNLIIQRYIASGFGYKYFSSPFTSDTVGDFSNDINLAATFPAYYRHDENLATNGWVAYTAGAGSLNTMQGYAANLGSSTVAKTVDMKGVVNNHNFSKTLLNHNMPYTQGFNLVGNPYPSPINWDAASGWTKTNIDNAVYYFNAGSTDQYTGVYSSYVNGISSDGIAGSTIAAMQGFFVHVSNGTFPVTGTLGVTNSVRILNSTASFYRVYGKDEQPLIRLTAAFSEDSLIADPVTIYFSGDAAGKKFNKQLDALKLMNTDDAIPNLFAVTADAAKLSINAVAAPYDAIVTIPLGLVIKKEGWINFNAKQIKNIPVGTYIYLTDIVRGVNYDLQKDPNYRLMLAAGDYENRFFLKFSLKNPDAVTNTPDANERFNVYSSGGKLYIQTGLAAGEKVNITVVNTIGQIVGRQEISGSGYQPVNISLTNGVYVVNCSGLSTNHSKKIFIGKR